MKFLKRKNWIDWVKAIIAIDIAAVGIGLVFQQQIHILANIFGSVSRIIFGMLYLVVAAAIFRGVFPEFFQEAREKIKHSTHNEFAPQENEGSQHSTPLEPKETIGEVIDKTAKKVDNFVQKRAQEVKDEVNRVLD